MVQVLTTVAGEYTKQLTYGTIFTQVAGVNGWGGVRGVVRGVARVGIGYGKSNIMGE